MSTFARIEEQLSRLPGRPTLHTQWVESGVALDFELTVRAYPQFLRSTRWLCYLGMPVVVISTLLAFGPTGQEKFLADYGNGSHVSWIAGDLALVVFGFLVALGLLYTARHLPTPGRFPNCEGCGRVEETRHAMAEERRKCRRCGVNVPLDRVVVPKRRALRSL